MDKEQMIATMKQVLDIQGYDGNWNYDEYMYGMYNGMEFMLSIAEEREPNYRKKPSEWVVDNKQEHVKEVADK